jgi:hypothetical protein
VIGVVSTVEIRHIVLLVLPLPTKMNVPIPPILVVVSGAPPMSVLQKECAQIVPQLHNRVHVKPKAVIGVDLSAALLVPALLVQDQD